MQTTTFGIRLEVEKPVRGIVILPSAKMSAADTWTLLVADHVEDFHRTRTEALVYEPIEPAGFYESRADGLRLQAILRHADYPVVLAGGSMGGYGAVRTAQRCLRSRGRMPAGIWTVSPVLDLTWAVGWADEHAPELASEIHCCLPSLSGRTLLRNARGLDDVPLAMIWGDRDDVIGEVGTRAAVRRWMTTRRGWSVAYEVRGGGHTDMNFDTLGMLAFAVGVVR